MLFLYNLQKIISCNDSFESRIIPVYKLKDDIKNTMAYSEYMELNRQAKVIQTEIDRLNIERDVWDKAREICMDIADEEA